MMTLNIKDKEYKVKFGFNSFADSDLLDRVQQIATLLSDDSKDRGFGMLRELFVVVRELLYVGFKRCNPVETIEEVGDLLDEYMEDTPKDEDGNPLEDRGIFAIFFELSNELANEGFLADFVGKIMAAESEQEKAKKPQDHKKKATKK